MEQQQTAQPTPQAMFSPEQLMAIKNSLIATLSAKYIQFCNELRQMPGHEGMKITAYNHLDNGLLWMKESILNMAPNAIVPAPNPENVQPGSAAVEAPVESVTDAKVESEVQPQNANSVA